MKLLFNAEYISNTFCNLTEIRRPIIKIVTNDYRDTYNLSQYLFSITTGYVIVSIFVTYIYIQKSENKKTIP